MEIQHIFPGSQTGGGAPRSKLRGIQFKITAQTIPNVSPTPKTPPRPEKVGVLLGAKSQPHRYPKTPDAMTNIAWDQRSGETETWISLSKICSGMNSSVLSRTQS